MKVHHAALALCAAVSLALAAAPTATLQGKLVLPVPKLAPGAPPPAPAPPARVVLDGGAQEVLAPSRDGGAFVLERVPVGAHSLEIFHRDLVFPVYRVEVHDGAPATATEVRYPGAPPLPALYPLEAAPVARAFYFEDRPPSSLWGYARSPMVLMMGGFLLLMLCMRSMDPEALKEAQEAQGEALQMPTDPWAAVGQLFSGGGEAPAARIEGGGDGTRRRAARAT